MNFKTLSDNFIKKCFDDKEVKLKNNEKAKNDKDTEKSIFDNSSNNDINFIDDVEEAASKYINILSEFESIQEEIYDVPPEDNVEDIVQNATVGEVFELPNENYAYIKTADGKYERLDISKKTYDTLFGNISIRYGLPDLDKKSNKLSDNLSKIFQNNDTKAYLLKCLSENENGDITVTIPSSQYSYTFEAGKDLREYDSSNYLSSDCRGIQMFELTFGAMYQDSRIKRNQNVIMSLNDEVLEESKNYSPEFHEKIESLFNYTNENGIDLNTVCNVINLLQNGADENTVKEYIDDESFELLKEIPKDEVQSVNLGYIYNLGYKNYLNLTQEYLKQDPFCSGKRAFIFGESNVLSSLGLDIFGNSISEDALEKAKKFIEYAQCEEDSTYNVNYIAAYLNNNPCGEEILNTVMNIENLNYHPAQIIDLLKKGFEDNADVNFLTKAAELNYMPAFLFTDNRINSDNIDLAILLKENHPLANEGEWFDDFKYISTASEILPHEQIEQYILDGNYKVFEEPSNYVQDIVRDFKNDGTTRSELLKKDLGLIYESFLTGKDIADLTVPSISSINDGLKDFNTGDVFEVDGEDFIYIKTSDNEYEQLDISKESYMKLFPPIQRYMSKQGAIGDCYLVSSLNNMMTNPNLRHVLLNCFSEDEEGNITVDLPNGNYTFTLENGKKVADYLPEQVNLGGIETRGINTISNSSAGMQMLELSYGIYLKDMELSKKVDSLEKINNSIADLYTDEQINALEKLCDYLDENSRLKNNNYTYLEALSMAYNYIDQSDTVSKEMMEFVFFVNFGFSDNEDFYKFINMAEDCQNCGISYERMRPYMERIAIETDIQTLQNDTLGITPRNLGGFNPDVFNAFGIESESADPSQLQNLLNDSGIKIVAGGTIGTSDKLFLNEELNIAGRHAYTIYPKQQENGEWIFEVINPWDEAQTSLLSEQQIYEYFSHIDYIIQ